MKLFWPGLFFFVLSLSALRADSLPLTDNVSPPFMGIFEGNAMQQSAQHTDDYAAWLNRTLVWGHDTFPYDWKNIEGEDWILKPWSDWVQAKAGRRMVWSVAMLPKDHTGTLAHGAAGAYNSHYQALAENLVKYNLGNSILRLGWEFDGGWYPWKVRSDEDAKNFALYWQQIVKTMRAVPGAEKLQFCWNGAQVWLRYPLEEAYPGDDYVDYVGLDIYDSSYEQNTYPYPPDDSDSDMARRQQLAWDRVIYPARMGGILAWTAIATAHHKPFAIPEWGVMRKKDGHGGLDDPAFIQKMYNFIQDPANNVYFASYWDYANYDSDADCKISPTGGYQTYFPKSAALFKQLFSLPASGPPPASP